MRVKNTDSSPSTHRGFSYSVIFGRREGRSADQVRHILLPKLRPLPVASMAAGEGGR